MKETRLTPTPCPRCGHKLDAASSPEANVEPNEGDFTICLKCQDILRFYRDESDDLIVRKVTEEDILEAPLDQIARFQRMLTQIKAQANRRAKLKSKARAARKKRKKTRSR